MARLDDAIACSQQIATSLNKALDLLSIKTPLET